MTTVTVIDGQNLFDISTQKSGSISGVFFLAAQNGNRSITDDLDAGVALNCDIEVANKAIYDYFQSRDIVPGTTDKDRSSDGLGYANLEYPDPILTCE